MNKTQEEGNGGIFQYTGGSNGNEQLHGVTATLLLEETEQKAKNNV